MSDNKRLKQLINEGSEIRQQINEPEDRDIRTTTNTDTLLRENKEIWRALMKATHESLVLIDREGTVLLSNEAGARRLGKSVEEFTGMCLYDYFSPDVERSLREQWDKVIAKGELLYFQDTRAGRSYGLSCYPVLTEESGVSVAAVFVHDITERKQAKGLLQKERETFFSILQKAPYGIFVNDDHGKFILVNPEATNITGYTVEDIPLGRVWFTKAYPDTKYRKNVIETWKRDVTKRGIDRTFSVCRKDGVVKELEFRAAILPDGKAVTMFSDVTEYKMVEEELKKHKENLEALVEERTASLTKVNEYLQEEIAEHKKTEESLRKSEEKYRNIFENAVEGIFQTTPAGRFLSVNPALARMYGYASPEEMIASVTNIEEQLYVDSENRHKFKELLDRHGIVEAFEMEGYRKDGGKLRFSLYARAARNPDGKTLYYEGIINDITQQKEAEAKLIESEERYRTAIESSNDGVALVLEGNLLYVNQKLKEIFGYGQQEEITGKPISMVIHPDDRDMVASINHLRQNGSPVPSQYEFKGIRKDGTLVSIEVSASRIIYHGEHVSLAFLRDITERKQIEEDRKRLILELQEALAKVKTLSGLLPICASCKKIRNDQGNWEQIESYVRDRSEANFSHGICPECAEKLYLQLHKKK